MLEKIWDTKQDTHVRMSACSLKQQFLKKCNSMRESIVETLAYWALWGILFAIIFKIHDYNVWKAIVSFNKVGEV